MADTISARGETWASYAVGDGDGSRSNKKQPESSGSKADVADTQGLFSNVGREHTEQSQRQVSELGDVGSKINTARSNWWKLEPSVGRVANGIPHWLDEPGDIPRVSTGVPNRVQRFKGLGNAIVPQIAMRIGQTIKATYNA